MFNPEQFSKLVSSERKTEVPLSLEEISQLTAEYIPQIEQAVADLKKVEQSTKEQLRGTRHLLKKLVLVLGLLSASSCSPNRAPSPYDVARLKTPPSAGKRDEQFVKRNVPNISDQTLVSQNFFSDKK